VTTINSKSTIAGLTAMGWTLDPQPPTRKYAVYRNPDFAFRLLIGKSGALRKLPHGGTVAGSISLTGGRYHRAICQMESERKKFDTTYMCQDAVERLMQS
jgi:hypothetical protein